MRHCFDGGSGRGCGFLCLSIAALGLIVFLLQLLQPPLHLFLGRQFLALQRIHQACLVLVLSTLFFLQRLVLVRRQHHHRRRLVVVAALELVINVVVSGLLLVSSCSSARRLDVLAAFLGRGNRALGVNHCRLCRNLVRRHFAIDDRGLNHRLALQLLQVRLCLLNVHGLEGAALCELEPLAHHCQLVAAPVARLLQQHKVSGIGQRRAAVGLSFGTRQQQLTPRELCQRCRPLVRIFVVERLGHRSGHELLGLGVHAARHPHAAPRCQ